MLDYCIGVIVPYEMQKGKIDANDITQAKKGYYRVMIVYPDSRNIITAYPLSSGQGHADNYANYQYSSYKIGDKVIVLKLNDTIGLILGSIANLTDVEIDNNITVLHNSIFGNEISIVEPRFINYKYASGLIYVNNNNIVGNGSLVLPYKKLTPKTVTIENLLSSTLHPIISFASGYTSDPKHFNKAMQNFVKNATSQNKNDVSLTTQIPDNTVFLGGVAFKSLYAPESRNVTSNLSVIYNKDVYSSQIQNTSETIPYIAANYNGHNANREYIDIHKNAYNDYTNVYYIQPTKSNALYRLFSTTDPSYNALIYSDFVTGLKLIETKDHYTDATNVYYVYKIDTINLSPNVNINAAFPELKRYNILSQTAYIIKEHDALFMPNNNSNGIKERYLLINNSNISETIAYWFYNINNTLGRNGFGLINTITANESSADLNIQLGALNTTENGQPSINSAIQINASVGNGGVPTLEFIVGDTTITIQSGNIHISGANVIIDKNIQANMIYTNQANHQQVVTENLTTTAGGVANIGGTVQANSIQANSIQASNITGGLNNAGVGAISVPSGNLQQVQQQTSTYSSNQTSGNNSTQPATTSLSSGLYKHLVKQQVHAQKPSIEQAFANTLNEATNFLNTLAQDLNLVGSILYNIICNLLALIAAALYLLLAMLMPFITNALAALSALFQKLLQQMLNMVNQVLNAIKNVINTMLQVFNNILKKFEQEIGAIINKVATMLASIIGKILSIVATLLGIFIPFEQMIFDFLNALNNFLNALMSLFHLPSCVSNNPYTFAPLISLTSNTTGPSGTSSSTGSSSSSTSLTSLTSGTSTTTYPSLTSTTSLTSGTSTTTYPSLTSTTSLTSGTSTTTYPSLTSTTSLTSGTSTTTYPSLTSTTSLTSGTSFTYIPPSLTSYTSSTIPSFSSITIDPPSTTSLSIGQIPSTSSFTIISSSTGTSSTGTGSISIVSFTSLSIDPNLTNIPINISGPISYTTISSISALMQNPPSQKYSNFSSVDSSLKPIDDLLNSAIQKYLNMQPVIINAFSLTNDSDVNNDVNNVQNELNNLQIGVNTLIQNANSLINYCKTCQV